MSNCDGRCCAVFTIADDFFGRVDTTIDGAFIADMLVPLTREEALARAEHFDVPPDQADPTEGWSPFTCRHWDEATRLCTVYEQRPGMCREYPYENQCRHGCGFCAPEDVRARWREIRKRREAEKAAA